MSIYVESWLSEAVIAGSLVTLALYVWFQLGYKHWKKRGVLYEEPTFPFGNVGLSFLGQKGIGQVVYDIYKKAQGERFVGFFSFRRPLLLIRDPNLIRNVLVKDFSAFQDRGVYMDEEEPLMRQLFFLPGYEWKQRRAKLSPAYTTGKLKIMFKTIQDCSQELINVVAKEAERGESVDAREMIARFATDVIVSVGFGIEPRCQQNPEAEFRHWGRKVFEPSFKSSFSFRLMFINPRLADFLRIKGGVTAISSYFRKMISDNIDYREKNKISRKDFMELLIQLRNKGTLEGEKQQNGYSSEEYKIPLNDLSAEAFAFFIAGFETSTTSITFTLHELALNQEILSKLQREIDTVLQRHGGDVTYEAISEMYYLDKVVSETLRKYPPLPLLNRDCVTQYKIPDSDLVLGRGAGVVISLLGLHYDPEHYPDPERYDPERFSEEEKAKRHSYVYLPFGEGPRICIGMRLGLLQTKVGLVNILAHYSVKPSEKTETNPSFNGRTVLLFPTNGLHMRFEKRCKS